MKLNPSFLYLKKIFNIISENNGHARFIGGCVRDSLLSLKINDIDIATNLEPETISAILQKYKIKTFPTGIKHGTITMLYNDKNHEITTLRKDLICLGRHAHVEFTKNWIVDAQRRDFTFNAMSQDFDGTIYDYFNGQNDLKNGILKFVGDPLQRITEDYLRILRALRFYIRFCVKNIDENIIFAFQKTAHNIEKLSGERIKNEMFKILSHGKSYEALQIMNQSNITPYIFLNKKKINFNSVSVIDSKTIDPIVKLAVIIKSNKINYEAIVDRWKFSKKNKEQLKTLLHNNISYKINQKIQKRFIITFGKDVYNQLLISTNAEKIYSSPDVMKIIERMQKKAVNVNIPLFPIGGKDLLKICPDNKQISYFLAMGKEYWHAHNYKVTKTEIMHYIQKQINL